MYDFFISHSSKDKKNVVDEFVKELKKHFNVWYDSNNILTGDTILTEVNKGLNQSYCLIVILTDNFMKSKWTFYEAGRFSGMNHRRIIPLYLDMNSKNQELCKMLFGKLEKLESSSSESIKFLENSLSDCKSANPFLQMIDKLEEIRNNFINSKYIDSMKIAIGLKEYLKLIGIETKYSIPCLKDLSFLIGKSILSLKQKQVLTEDYESLLAELKNNKIGPHNLSANFEYIFKAKVEDYINEYVTLNQSLLNILNYYKTYLPSEVETAYFDDLIIAPFDCLTIEDFKEIYEIDKQVLREDTIASIDTSYSWYKYNNRTHIVAKINNKVVGYFAALPITNELYKKILSGDFKDKDFTVDSLKQYDIEGFYRLYIAAVAIHPDYQNTNVFPKLYHALINFIKKLAIEGEYLICEVLAEASTPQGKKYCEMMKMKHYINTPYNTGLYRLFLIPPEFEATNKKIKDFKDFCLAKYDEYKDYFK
jgi:ribosomal protein S18 acetylase RimI-like enzyme